MRRIVLIVHNVRSCYNVGALLRTADGLGVECVYLTGYTPYPLSTADSRLPHESRKVAAQIHKTSLGAEETVAWEHAADIGPVLQGLISDGFVVAALEQADHAVSLPSFRPPDRIALIVGREVEGLEPEVLSRAERCLEIPMFGAKESFNVAIAAAVGLYHLRFSIEPAVPAYPPF
jgi:23S rRNA (guanosine2251-2'-O)-methyltransferase